MADKYTKSAKCQDCQVRIPGSCNFNSDTTVPAHLNGAGMGIKHSSIHLAYACSSCHDVIDGRVQSPYTKEQLELWHLQGVIRTQIIMIKEGVLIL